MRTPFLNEECSKHFLKSFSGFRGHGFTRTGAVTYIGTVCMSVAGKLVVLDIAEVNPEVGSPDEQAMTLDTCNKIVSGWFSNDTMQCEI